jgi:hypothetical protein
LLVLSSGDSKNKRVKCEMRCSKSMLAAATLTSGTGTGMRKKVGIKKVDDEWERKDG